MWVARNKDFGGLTGDLYLFMDRPIRAEVGEYGFWYGQQLLELDINLFPDLKWEDEPLEVELTAKQTKK